MAYPDGTGFTVKEPYRSEMMRIGNADSVVVLRSGTAGCRDMCLYDGGDGAVTAAWMSDRSNKIKITTLDGDGFRRDLLDGDFLPPKTPSTQEPDHEDLSEDAFSLLQKLYSGDASDDVSFIAGAYVLDRMARVKKSLLAMHTPRGAFLLYYDEIGSGAGIYSPEAFRTAFNEKLWGGELL